MRNAVSIDIRIGIGVYRSKHHFSFLIYIFHFLLLFFHLPLALAQRPFTFVELNCENLFDCRHDSLKQDTEWTPEGLRRWTPDRYWRKVNNIGQAILACQPPAVHPAASAVEQVSCGVPDLVALVEVENDSVLRDLTLRSLLRGAGYEYLMTESPDVRGIDVALLYQPFSFRPFCYDCLTVEPLEGMRPTRDILYVRGETIGGDTLHVFVVHAPSRYGGERETRPNRRIVAERLMAAVRQLPPAAKVIIAGDFNDDAESPALQYLVDQGLCHISCDVQGCNGQAHATYRYQGWWQPIDHVFVSAAMQHAVERVFINDAPFLVEEDTKYGGVKPFRTYNGYRYHRGFSDHLPLVVRFR